MPKKKARKSLSPKSPIKKPVVKKGKVIVKANSKKRK
jgi:hypothetical protein